jgi:hypothetical protein
MKKGQLVVATKQNKAQGEETEIRVEAVASSQQHPNRTIWFGKLDHLVSLGSVERGTSNTIASGTAPTPHWCPPGLTHSQRRRIQRMRAHKLREESVEKERDEHFNTI